ncbi:MAG: divalent metal cation transporter [Planctomycetaceae bacterium]
MSSNDTPPAKPSILSSLGPAIITASVVLGPGSIVSASKLGNTYGFSMTWVILLAVILMICVTALSARLGVVLEKSLCEELKTRAGTPVAILAGVSVFLIAACFQYSNNLGILLAVEPLIENLSSNVAIGVIVGLNIFIIAVLWGMKSLYNNVEKLMKILVAMMTIAFAINLGFALMVPTEEPAVEAAAAAGEAVAVTAPAQTPVSLTTIIAMFGTTFSVAGAFYQAYLVREKGWTVANIKQGFVDSTLGISLLGIITLMIMATAAIVLHGKANIELTSAADVALSLEPAFGKAAVIIFCLGIFAGAFSSFLVNSMIGGAMLSDGLGLGYQIDNLWPKVCTTLALLTGMGVAVYVKSSEVSSPANLIVFAQSMTVIANPVLAAALLWLATRPDLEGERRIPAWLKVMAVIGLIMAIGFAYRTLTSLLG